MKLRALIPVAALALAALAAACGGGPSGGKATDLSAAGALQNATSGSAAESAPGFPTGPAITVQAGYQPPSDHVPSTGAYLPANGKPTLVYVDAIW